MASINGLSLKKVKYFQGKEGTAAQGDLYLGKKKIAFWSQDANGCIEDSLDMELGYSEHRLRQAIITAHPEKHQEKVAQNGRPYTLDYELESLMGDLLALMDAEKAWKNATKAGYMGMLEMTDGFHISRWRLPKTLYDNDVRTVESVKAQIPPEKIKSAKASMFQNMPLKEAVFWSKEDFAIGAPLELDSIATDSTKA